MATGNGSNIKYLRAPTTPSQNDPIQPIGSLANPYEDFSTALQSVPDGGKLVVIGGGQPFTICASDNTSRNLTITGVNDAKITGGMGNYAALTFIGGMRTVAVDNLTFMYCQAGAGAGALGFYDCPAKISRCRFSYCNAGQGGAIHLAGSSAEITDTSFHYNTGMEGGGIWASGCNLLLSRSRFVGQSAYAPGGAVYAASCTGEISSCLFAANTTGSVGGAAVRLSGTSVPSLSYCTIADHVNAFGAPISCASTAPLPITASVIWGNKLAGGTTTNVDGPASITYTTTQTTSYSGTGNNISDPMFLRSQHPQMNAIPGAGYGLAAGSPMIDRGSNALVPALDVDGLPRRRFLPNPSSSWISNADRGAFDYSDADGDNMPDGWELAYAFDGANPDDRDLDADQDGFSNFEEYAAKTDPRSSGSRPGPVIYVSVAGNDSSLGGIP